MMGLTGEQEKKALVVLAVIFAALLGYRFFGAEPQKTAPLAYPQGAVASSAMRPGRAADRAGADPLSIFLAKREERYPGTARDIFRMENPAPKPKTKPTPTVRIATAPVPTAPVKTPEELAAERARAELQQFKFLGYLTDKDNTLFLSREGELFMVKAGDKLMDTYRVKEAGKDAVMLIDTATKVEVRIELSGGETPQEQPRKQQPLRPMR